MAPDRFLHEHNESSFWGVLADGKIYHLDKLFVRQTLRQHEWLELESGSVVRPSAAFPQRYHIDAAVQKYLREHTNIPLPSFATTFEDDGVMYLATEFVPGVQMDELPDKDRNVVEKELLQHIVTLKSLRSDTPGVPGEALAVPPQRVCDFHYKYHSCWRPRPDVKGDLAMHNVLVDPKTLKITAIIDLGVWPLLARVVRAAILYEEGLQSWKHSVPGTYGGRVQVGTQGPTPSSCHF